jgi:prepilin-type processing-associated H-X9-DG protein
MTHMMDQPESIIPVKTAGVGLAVASMVLGILSILCGGFILGVPAIVVGIFALRKQSGKGMAIAGIATGSIGTVVGTFVLVISLGIMLPALSMAREKALRINCASQMKSIGLCLKQYAMDYNDMLPPSGARGLDILVKNVYLCDPDVYVSPKGGHDQTPFQPGDPLREENLSYVFFGGINEAAYPANMPIAFSKPGPHANFVNVLFLDGRVKGYPGKFPNCVTVVRFLIEQDKDLDKPHCDELLAWATEYDSYLAGN